MVRLLRTGVVKYLQKALATSISVSCCSELNIMDLIEPSDFVFPISLLSAFHALRFIIAVVYM
jgi:hypothetical protein